MKKYIGTKEVLAEPMTMGDAYRAGLLQAGRVPSLAECAQAGYHVIYESGYGSWSPADVFGKAYRVADTFIDRLHIELDDLRGRYGKARAFLASPESGKLLWPAERLALEEQADLMEAYIRVLEERISLAGNKPEGTGV